MTQPDIDEPKSLRSWLLATKHYAARWLSRCKKALAKRLSSIVGATRHRIAILSRYKKFLPILGFFAIALMTAQVVGFSTRILPLGAVFVALVASGVLWVIPRRTFVTLFVNTFGWLPVTLGSLTYFFWRLYAENSRYYIDPTFFHASADVLPVLLLAAVVDVRRSQTLESKGLVLPIIGVFLGEVAALNALAFGYATAEDFAAVASSLVSTTVALVLAVMADLSEPPAEEKDKTASSDVEIPPSGIPGAPASNEQH